MKKTKILIVIASILLFAGCWMIDYGYAIEIKNEAPYTVYFAAFNNATDASSSSVRNTLYDKRTIFKIEEVPSKTTNVLYQKIIHKIKEDDYDHTIFVRDMYKKYNMDTMYIVVYRKDTSTGYYTVLQRYNIGLQDAEKIFSKSDICFPPSNNMKSIKMWPPYGTYDEWGYRKDDTISLRPYQICHKEITFVNNSDSHVRVLQYSKSMDFNQQGKMSKLYLFRYTGIRSNDGYYNDGIVPPHSSGIITLSECVENITDTWSGNIYICDVNIDKSETYNSLDQLEQNPYILRKVYLQDSLESLRGNDYTIYYP